MHVRKTGWFLDLYPGYQTNRVAVEAAGLTYISVSIVGTFKLGPGPNAEVVTSHVDQDLALIDPEDLLTRIQHERGLSPGLQPRPPPPV